MAEQLPQMIANDLQLHRVRCFTDRAELFYIGKVAVQAGRQIITVPKLSPHMDGGSLRLRIKGPGLLEGMRTKEVFVADGKAPEELSSDELAKKKAELEQSIETAEDALALLEDQAEVLEQQLEHLRANRRLEPTDDSNLPEELSQLIDYYPARLEQLLNEQADNEEATDKQRQELSYLRSQLNQLGGGSRIGKHWQQAEVVFASEAAGEVTIELNYMVKRAGWAPRYDARVHEAGGPLRLELKAEVKNETQLDWQDVDLVLSTARPMRNAAIPELHTWAIGQDIPEPHIDYEMSADEGDNFGMLNTGAAPPEPAKEAPSLADTVTATEGMLSKEFNIGEPQTLPSRSRTSTLELEIKELEVAYHYKTVPKLEQAVFLVAQLPPWHELGLLPAPASVFYEGCYVGRSSLKPAAMDEQLQISLGREPKISVERKVLPDFTDKGSFLRGTIKKRSSFEWTLHNAGPAPVKVELLDQIPYSWEKAIKLELLEAAGAKHNEANGFLRWELEVKASGKESRKVVYQLTHAKDRRLEEVKG